MITAGINGAKASRTLPMSMTIINMEQKKKVSMQ
jgi:hypothetical protein